MFQQEQQAIETKIKAFCVENDIPLTELKWGSIPFNGEWGISTSFFQLAANEAKAGKGKGLPVPQRAAEMAEQAKAYIGSVPGISRVEAAKAYLNLYFSTPEYASRVVDTVLGQGSRFGAGAPKSERVMVEYAQPNTHHSFHIGHFRNTILGEALARIVEFAGFETIRASYPGDIGLGVITVVWAYEKFYKGKEPSDIHERGQWMLKIYAEATNLLAEKENETPEEKAQREAYEAERREIYRKWDAGDPEIRKLWLETREWSLIELRDILKMMDVKIDVWFFESEVDEPSKAIVDGDFVGLVIDHDNQKDLTEERIDEWLDIVKPELLAA